MSTNIFWYQPAKLSDADVVLLNNKQLEDNAERSQAFLTLKKAADRCINKKRPWYGVVNGYKFVKGSLEQLDERGRKLSFIFLSDGNDWQTSLQNVLQSLNMKLDHDTTVCVGNAETKIKPQTIAAIALFAIVVVIIIVLHYGK